MGTDIETIIDELIDVADKNDVADDNEFRYGNEQLVLQRDNVLIESSFHASLLETKIMALALSKLQLRGVGSDGRFIVKFSVTELRDFIGASDNTYFYKKLDGAAKGLLQNYFVIRDPQTNSFVASVIVTTAGYSNGIFAVEFNRSIRPYIFQLKGNYTKMSVKMLMSFDNGKKSNSSYRIYELLKEEKYRITKKNKCAYKQFSLAEFIVAVGLIDLSVKKVRDAFENGVDWDTIVFDIAKFSITWGDLNRRVLSPAKEEINRITDIICDYKPKRVGVGGRVRDILFRIEDNPNYQMGADDKDDMPDDALIIGVENLVKEPLSLNDKVTLLKTAGCDLERISNAYQLAKSQRGKINNLTAWMVTAIKDNWENNRPVAFYGNEGERPFDETLAIQKYQEEQKMAVDPEQDELSKEWERLTAK